MPAADHAIAPGGTPPAPPARVLYFAHHYRWPLLAVALALPLTIAATVRSTAWIGTTFPAFFVMENAVVPTVSGWEWPPERERFFHRQVVAVDGRSVGSGSAVYARVARRPPGTPISYTLSGPHGRHSQTVPSMRFSASDWLQTYGILLFFGAINLVLGVVVAFMQPATRQARVFLLHTFVAGIYPISAVFLHAADSWWLGRLCLAAECLVSATFIHLALVFPVEYLRDHHRRWIYLPYVASFVLLAWVLWGFDQTPPRLGGLHAAYGYIAVALAFFVVALAYGYASARQPETRLRIQAVLPGAALAAGVQLVFFLDNALAGRQLPVQLGLVTPAFYYASIAYAIGKHDLFDIDRVVRQSFVYGFLSAVVVGSYALLVVVPTQLFPDVPGTTFLSLAFVLLLALCFDPLRRLSQNVVDRTFYRTRLDYRSTISGFSEFLTTLLDRDELAERVTAVVGESMQLESTTLLLLSGRNAEVWHRTANGALDRWIEPDGAKLAATVPSATRALIRIDSGHEAPAPLRALVEQVDAALVLPLALRGMLVGFLCLGARRSGRLFGSEDVELLRTLAAQIAIAACNAESYREIEELNRDLDDKVRQRTAELDDSNQKLRSAYRRLQEAQSQLVQSERMASLGQLVAGVAHELNNPASFVEGSLENLEDHWQRLSTGLEMLETSAREHPELAESLRRAFAGLGLDDLRRAVPELLEITHEGAERISAIVADLRAFVRADQQVRKPYDVREGIESTLRLLRPRIREHAVEIDARLDPVPEIVASGAQLNQVWMNLVDNALDAVADVERPSIRVRVSLVGARREAGGTSEERSGPRPSILSAHDCIQIAISDNGPGMPDDARRRVFEPFFTTKPVGSGTGLGLSIAYGIVQSHGGTIEVESAPGAGTAFRVHLPIGEP